MNLFAFDPITGTHADVVVRRRNEQGASLVYLGDRRIGEVWGPDSFDGWTAISHSQKPYLFGLRMVTGFGRRRQAVNYLLQVGVHLPQNRCVPEIDHHPIGYHGMFNKDECFLG